MQITTLYDDTAPNTEHITPKKIEKEEVEDMISVLKNANISLLGLQLGLKISVSLRQILMAI